MRTQSRVTRWIGAALIACAAVGSAWAQSLGWTQLPGAANDIGVGGPNNTAWVIGTNVEGGGYGIYRWNPAANNWDKIPGSAVRIDVDNKGNAWVVNSAKQIYRYNGSSWDLMPGAANDIGIGANGTVWVIGNDKPSPNDFGIYRWNGSNWDKMPGWAVRVDVDPQGNAWVINSTHNIFRWDGSKWVQLPGAALDIGIGADGTAFVVGTDQGVYKWSGGNWVRMEGGLTNISVDSKGRPWGVNSGKAIYASGGAQVVAGNTPTPTGPSGSATNPQLPPGKTNPLLQLVSNSRGPALSPADTKAVCAWIGRQVASSRQEYCYKNSYGRGVGTIPTGCTGGKQNDAGLCYTPCNPGYGAAGPVCWQYCPSGYTDTGALCHYSAKSLTTSLVRSGCHLDSAFGCIIPAYDCPSGYTNAGLFCALNTPSVPPGYSGLTGLDLTKKSYGRGAGTIPTDCGSGKQNDAGLCYPNCNSGMYGVGPVCWQSCPSGKTDCAAGCSSSTSSCVSNTASMVIAPITLAANIITAGTAGEALTGAKGAIQSAAKLISERTAITEAIAIANATYQAYNSTYLWVNDYVGNFAQLTSTDINNTINSKFSPAAARYVKEQYAMVHLNMVAGDDATKTMLNVLNAASGFDPTGVSGVVSAFAKPMCAGADAFPAVSARY